MKELAETDMKHPKDTAVKAEFHSNREVSCRVINSVVKYLDSNGYDCATLIAATPNGVLVVDSESRIVLANNACTEIFAEEGALIGRKLSEILPGIIPSMAMLGLQSAGKSFQQVEFRYSAVCKKKILTANILEMGHEQLLIVISDITDERDKQERIFMSHRQASLGDMAAGIAHEINNPLTSIIALSQLLLEEELPAEMKQDVNTISSEAQRAGEIVKNLFSFARKHAPSKQPIQLNNAIEDVLKLRHYEQTLNNITVECQFDSNLPEVMADYFQMQQVFLNIILNAEQAMAEAHGKGTLSITGEKVDGMVRLSFSDDGPGIPRENLPRVFDPFFTTKEVGKGTGLGLSICYGIVTAHNGRIHAQSEVGRGATFVIELSI